MKVKNILRLFALNSLILAGTSSCSLDELPLDTFVPENSFVNQIGFEMAVNTLYNDFRVYTCTTEGKYIGFGFHMPDYLSAFSDVASGGQLSRNQAFDYRTLTPDHPAVGYYWDQAYSRMIKNSNVILSRIDRADIKWNSEADKNKIIAQAKWFRALAYRYLICLFGDVPYVDKEETAIKLDYKRENKETILDHMIEDLEFSAKYLPDNPDKVQDGELTMAAAKQLLAICYLHKANLSNNKEWYNKAVEATSWIIDSKYYNLMTSKFGETLPAWRVPDDKNDPYPYLFWENNTNRKKGNRETILAVQFEYNVKGGLSGYSPQMVRRWGPSYYNMMAPDGTKMVLTDTIGRPLSFVRPTKYALDDVYANENAKDLRNNTNNMRRYWFWNNNKSAYYGKQVDASKFNESDLFQNYQPMLRKTEGLYTNLGAGVDDNKNYYYMRLAETYLLRAEAYLMLGGGDNLAKAANDINAVRSRAKANLVTPDKVTLDYILDERCRELIIEEPRLLTLARLGKEVLLSRVRKYNFYEVAGIEMAAKTIQDKNWLWPIPQSAIESNLDAKIPNNEGY